jgi:hypothetical protein
MPTTWQLGPRKRPRQRPQNETASVSPNWNGPHFARLDAWFERPERILAEIPQRAGQS